MNEEEKKISGQTVSEAKFDDKKVKKVAIYSRTNSRDEESVIDVEKETELLMEKIQEHDNWEFYKKYTDKGLYESSRRCRRTELNKMLQDAKELKIDIILCTSLARFARNIGESIDVLLRLKRENPEHPVGIYFANEDYYSLDFNPLIDSELIPLLMKRSKDRQKAGLKPSEKKNG